MKEDITRPKVEDIGMAVVKEEVDGETKWVVYLLNLKDELIHNILISSKGYGKNASGEDKKTSVLRHYFKELQPGEYVQVELIMDDLFALHNEFWVSFYIGRTIYDKKYIFPAESIKEKNFTEIPLLNKQGVFHM